MIFSKEMSPRSLPEICAVWNLLSKVVTELTFCSWQGSRCISWSVHWEWLRTVCLGLFSCADFDLSLSKSLIIIHYSKLFVETWDVLDSSGVDGVCVSQLLWSQMESVANHCQVQDAACWKRVPCWGSVHVHLQVLAADCLQISAIWFIFTGGTFSP